VNLSRPSISRLTLRTTGPDDTRALAAAVARGVEPGDAVVLTGELGAGKTCFVQGAAAALGVERRVTSPTFTIVRSYDGDLPVVHVDVYRLDEVQDFVELGEENVLASDAVTFIEWGDTVDALLPADLLEVELLHVGNPEGLHDDTDPDALRTVHLRGRGRWASVLVDLVADLGPWLLEGPRIEREG
jgi:tRNA threonylcarbamoyladenosine biosynthesis protein TsaE